MSDFNQAVTSAQLRGARLVALFNDPDVVYKASEEEMLKLKPLLAAIDRSLVKIITSRTGPRGRRVDDLLEFFNSQISDLALTRDQD
ncbi:hypothetical protein CEK26_010327 [Fusarium fujikuroi]|nr:hypothetical protein CEK27_010343 [Fusarium fujikuroi]QGI83609.1 hypothetical protein CEK25_010338 [Fusarium fujikuroi]QGI97258.1 hypothetical protein CEK26_010327 [Fusarium fujikuroi]